MASLNNSAKTSGVSGARQSLCVVLLEDDEEDAFLVRAAFAKSVRYAAEVIHVKTADAAAELCQQLSVDLVIADFWLGGENSLAFLRHIGGRAAAIPALLLTGVEGQDVEEKSFEAGALNVMSKRDLSRRNLDVAVAATLRTHRVEREMRDMIEKQDRAVRTLARLLQGVGPDSWGLEGADSGASFAAPTAEVEISFERGDLLAAIATARKDALAVKPEKAGTIRFTRPNLPLHIDADMIFLQEAFTDLFMVLLRRMNGGSTLAVRLALNAGCARVIMSCGQLEEASLHASEDLFFASYIFRLHKGELKLNAASGQVVVTLPLRASSHAGH